MAHSRRQHLRRKPLALYTASTVYHAVQRPPAKRILRILDHSAIYLLIAGTYTPFMLVNLRGAWGWTLLGLVWTIALFWVAWKIVHVEQHVVVSTIVYIAMGWLVVIGRGHSSAPSRSPAWHGCWPVDWPTRSVWLSSARRACASATRCGTCSCSRAAPAIMLRSCATSCRTATYEASFRSLFLWSNEWARTALRRIIRIAGQMEIIHSHRDHPPCGPATCSDHAPGRATGHGHRSVQPSSRG